MRIQLYNYYNSGWAAWDDARLALVMDPVVTKYYYAPSTGSGQAAGQRAWPEPVEGLQ